MSIFDAPKAPEIKIPEIKAPPPMPQIQDAQNRARQQDALQKKKRGRSANIITGSRGDLTNVNTQSGGVLAPGTKRLLGQ